MSELDDALFPDILAVCHACGDEVPVHAGLNAVESMWMHEPECRAALAALADSAPSTIA